MEKPNFVRNGGIKLPIGFRFRPTDEELVVHYLKRKAHSSPLPASVIPELDVFQTNPWDLPGDSKEKRYFFCKRKGNMKKCNGITAESGYWKAMGKEKYVVDPGSNNNQAVAVGVKRSLVFCEGKKRPCGLVGTQWVMHEFRLVVVGSQMEDWVVCKIYKKKTKSRNPSNGRVKSVVSNGDKSSRNVEEIKACNRDTLREEISCSSGITEICSKADQEETSAYLCFSP
ncbi:hypothetical protein U1Q18_038148 [Sarracenia purpurea var. burkii]